MSDNTAANKDSAPKKPEISPEVQKVIDKSQLIQAQIQEAQIENVKAVYDLVAKIDKKRKDEIEKQFEEGVIQLEEVDEDDNVKQWTTKYRPMTTRAEEAVNEMLRTVKVFKKDIKVHFIFKKEISNIKNTEEDKTIEEIKNAFPGINLEIKE